MRPRQIFRIIITILVLFLLLSWCTTEREAAYSVFFGRDIGETGRVSDEDWAAFEKDVIAPALGGYTVIEGRGAYLTENSEIVVHEDTFILIYTAANESASQEKIESVSEAYKERFSQQSVLIMRTDSQLLSGGERNVEKDGGLFARIVVGLILIGLIGALIFGRPYRDIWR